MTRSTARFLADYLPSNFTIKTVNLTIELEDTTTQVVNELIINRQGEYQDDLILDGEKLTLISVSIDDVPLTADQYEQLDNHLRIMTNKNDFKLTIITQINPLDNTSLEGLFKSKSPATSANK